MHVNMAKKKRNRNGSIPMFEMDVSKLHITLTSLIKEK
jgi:hypothetical protein